MAREIDVIVAGHICLDIIPVMAERGKHKVEDLFLPGKLINVGAAAISTGGVVSNTGVALLHLGIAAELMGKVGNDLFGKAILAKLKEDNADGGMVVVDNEDTSYTIVLAPPGIDRIFFHNPGTNDTFGFDDIDFEKVSLAKLFHFGYPPLLKKTYESDGKELVMIFREAKRCGATTSLDMALPDPESPSGAVDWDRILKDTLPFVDIFLPSAEEAMFMLAKEKFLEKRKQASGGNVIDFLEADEISRIAEKITEYGVAIAGIKCGHRGLSLRTSSVDRLKSMGYAKPADYRNWGNRELWAPPFRIGKFTSALGAGDSCVAGFLAAFVRNEPVESALDYACAAGAQNVEAADAVSGVKSWEETTAMLREGWEKQKLDIGSSSWKFDARNGLWKGPQDAKKAS